ncbi:MAG: HD domain-containing protein [Clostridia bacterium]|nr:HD domain-containing protein [Clostridia bacterium]
MLTERLKKQIEFILEIDKEKNIRRQNHLTDGARRENDAEHAWHMAIMIYLLKEYADGEFDVAKAMIMALIHDIVEIDAGDTYAYDADNLKTQRDREEKAAERIFGILPKEQKEELKALFEEFEAGESKEAQFARAIDCFQPLLLNNANDGKDWYAHKVKKSQVVHRQRFAKMCAPEIWDESMKIIDRNLRLGSIADD